ncbi:MAG: type II/IV secretion system ATPase subunit [Desulfurococcaceae archaeon]
MKNPLLFFTRISSSAHAKSFIALVKNREKSKKGDIELARRIINEYLDIYLRGFKLESIDLDVVYQSYKLSDIIDVKIGSCKGKLYYIINEPSLTLDQQREILQKAIDKVFSDDIIQTNKSNIHLEKLNYENYLISKFTTGLVPLLPLTLDPYIEDIYLSRKHRRAYVIHNNFSWLGWLETNIVVEPSLVDRLVLALSRRIGKHISLVNPLAEGTYACNLRISLIYGDTISPNGSSIVIRKKVSDEWTITRLINEGTISSFIASYLWLVLEEKGWIIIAGHVGSGKTTLLQALLSLIPPYKKVISIEDIPEISGSTGLWEPLVEKNEVLTTSSQIDPYTLLKFALRRRPDYIVIGEVRGIEARLLIQASRLGHGVLNTIHADSPESVFNRLTSPPISIPRNLLNNIWSIIIITQEQHGKRKIQLVSEVSDDLLITNICDQLDGNCNIDKIIEKSIRLRKHYSKDELQKELIRRTLFLEKLVSHGVYSMNNLLEKLGEFYRSPETEVFSESIDLKGV